MEIGLSDGILLAVYAWDIPYEQPIKNIEIF
jgi:hypothetical protein